MRTSRIARLALAAATLLVCLGVGPGVPRSAEADTNANVSATVWPKMVRMFEAQDKKNAPAKGGVLFVGSSSIRMWPIKDFFPGLPSINRGIGGSRIAQVNLIADKIVLPYEPKVIVFYSGDNDIGGGSSPSQVLSDFQHFVSIVRGRLPNTQVVFLSIKPSLRLRTAWGKIREANHLIEDYCASDSHLHYVDVATPMLDESGKARVALLQKDGLHLNYAGYRLWSGIAAPVIKKAFND